MPITLSDWSKDMNIATDALARMSVIAQALDRADLLPVVVGCFRVLDAVNDAIHTGEPIVETCRVKATPAMLAELRRPR
jgi:hypothetical protein